MDKHIHKIIKILCSFYSLTLWDHKENLKFIDEDFQEITLLEMYNTNVKILLLLSNNSDVNVERKKTVYNNPNDKF